MKLCTCGQPPELQSFLNIAAPYSTAGTDDGMKSYRYLCQNSACRWFGLGPAASPDEQEAERKWNILTILRKINASENL